MIVRILIFFGRGTVASVREVRHFTSLMGRTRPHRSRHCAPRSNPAAHDHPYKAASALCTSGPFHISRNPIYLVDCFILAEASLLLHTFWPPLFAPLVWAALRFGVIGLEEEHLQARFGEKYREDEFRVRRWI